MVDNKTWIGITIMSLIVALGAIGYNITEDTYFCKERGIVIDCVRFSESGLRCYPNLMSNKGYRDCSSGWIEITDDRLIQEEPEIPTSTFGKRWLCSSINCTLIEEPHKNI